MSRRKSVYISCITSFLFFLSAVNGTEDELLQFPPNFMIGSATASYQVEGAWNLSGKTENVWDYYTHTTPHLIPNDANGDIACNSYYKYKDDVQMIKEMGMDNYRFSISWNRVLPTGYSNVINKEGVRYYHNLLDELEKYNITPMITLYHFDHPQVFQHMGGWTNELMVEWFADYARVIFKEFGDRVKIFSTMNEPETFCKITYVDAKHAPAIKIGRHAYYLCSQNALKAHARAYHIYDKEFRPKQNGQVGIVLNNIHMFPKNESDPFPAEVAHQYQFGLYAHPIFSKEGDWPDIVKQRINENSQFEGLTRSRLPEFTKEWIDYIRGSADYLGINYYTSKTVEAAPKPLDTVYFNDEGVLYGVGEDWPKTPSFWFFVNPEGFISALTRIKDEYNNPLVYITENGIADTGTLEDNQRLEYLYSHIKKMLIAINKHQCNVKAYAVWSLMDNFEWDRGYEEKFGIYQVDFNSPNRTRTPKKSALWLREVIRERKLLPIPTN